MNEHLVAKRIYIGAPIEYDSERKLLASTVQRLEEQHIPFIALANVEIGGRQVDCIVATPWGCLSSKSNRATCPFEAM
jgi:hypothetical protein